MLQAFPLSLARARIGLARLVAICFLAALLLVCSANKGSPAGTLLFALGMVLIAVGAAGRLWAALYISGYKKSELITSGPYSMSRHPLYFFSMLGFLGLGFATRSVTFAGAALLLYACVYPYVIRMEEDFLRRRFGHAFAVYAARTPTFIPSLRLLREPGSYLVVPGKFRHAVLDVVWWFWVVGIIEIVETMHETGLIDPILYVN